MKVHFFIPFVSTIVFFLLSGCNNEEKNDMSQSKEVIQDTVASVQEKVWEEFFGTLPCADCSGIETTLRLSPDGSRFQLESIYLGKKDNQYIDSGNVITQSGYQNNDNAIIYTLNSDEDREEQKYFLRNSQMSDSLHMLDREMKLIESDLNYTLVKILK